MSTNPKDATGVKKAPLALVPPAAIIAISDALADGAKKYGPQNWRLNDGVKATIYVGAAMRHIFAWVDGEENAEDSGVHHLSHAAACMAILLDARELGQMIDDRPTPGPAAAMLKARDKSNIYDESVASAGNYCNVGDTYICTRSRGHCGDHIAHGAAGRLITRWSGDSAD